MSHASIAHVCTNPLAHTPTNTTFSSPPSHEIIFDLSGSAAWPHRRQLFKRPFPFNMVSHKAPVYCWMGQMTRVNPPLNPSHAPYVIFVWPRGQASTKQKKSSLLISITHYACELGHRLAGFRICAAWHPSWYSMSRLSCQAQVWAWMLKNTTPSEGSGMAHEVTHHMRLWTQIPQIPTINCT